jgi:uroporphyrinogen decarboxylase
MSITSIPDVQAAPDFTNLLKVLRCQRPERPTLFEFFLNWDLERIIAFGPDQAAWKEWPYELVRAIAFRKAGYDYLTQGIPGFGFPSGERVRQQSYSINEGGVISDWESFRAYAWQNPDAADYGILDRVDAELPDGMQLIVNGPGGVEENVIGLVGYETLCFMMADDEELVMEIFAAVGSRLVRYYANAVNHPRVGAIISNDDWGFKTQTLLSVAQMRQYLFPWHQQITDLVHAAGKPVILHSCGFYDEIIDTVIDELHYDGRHSYEDGIRPVEEAYDELQGRIAVLGGLDLDFICRSTPEEVYTRAKGMLARAAATGGFALGTGNSVPAYIPHANYFAMLAAAVEDR